jgi:hypothetical protein
MGAPFTEEERFSVHGFDNSHRQRDVEPAVESCVGPLMGPSDTRKDS